MVRAQPTAALRRRSAVRAVVRPVSSCVIRFEVMRKAGVAVAIALLVSACLSSADLSGGGGGGGTSGSAPGTNPEAGTCAADLKNDVGNCGACGKVCGNQANAYGYCKDGACAIGCNTGFGDCDGKAETGCESTLATDSNHCGACGKSCGGARCVGGQCQPMAIAEIPGYIMSVAQDATDLYYGFSGGGGSYAVAKLAKDGSKGHTEVVTGIADSIYSLAVSDTQVYWTKASETPAAQPPDGAIYRAAKAGPSTMSAPWLSALRLPYQDAMVIAEGSAFYVTTETAGSVTTSTLSRAALTGTAGTPMAQSIKGGVYTMAVDGAIAYFYASGDSAGAGRGLYRCATSGCGTASTPVPGSPANTYIRDIVANGVHLYLSTGRAVARQKKDGTEFAVLGIGDSSYSDVTSFATDGTRLIWTERSFGGGPGSDEFFTWGCPVANCKDGRLPLVVPGEPQFVLVDDKAFYILTRTNSGAGTQTTVMRVLK